MNTSRILVWRVQMTMTEFWTANVLTLEAISQLQHWTKKSANQCTLTKAFSKQATKQCPYLLLLSHLTIAHSKSTINKPGQDVPIWQWRHCLVFLLTTLQKFDIMHSIYWLLPLLPDVLHDLIVFVIKLIYSSDDISCTNTGTAEWKKMKKKCRARLVLDLDNLKHLYEKANFLAYCHSNFFMKIYPSQIVNDWDIINMNCRPWFQQRRIFRSW